MHHKKEKAIREYRNIFNLIGHQLVGNAKIFLQALNCNTCNSKQAVLKARLIGVKKTQMVRHFQSVRGKSEEKKDMTSYFRLLDRKESKTKRIYQEG